MMRWYGCPLCGRCAETSRQLNAMGCEGKHVPLVMADDLLRAKAEIEALQKEIRILEKQRRESV
jgi:hypothetical protein